MDNVINDVLDTQGKTVAWLGRITGVSSISKIVSGSNTGLDTAQKISAALGVGIDDLWPNQYRTETRVIETEELVLVDSSSSSVFE